MFQRYLNVCSDFFGLAGKMLDKKAKVNSQIYDVTNWETNNQNVHIAQYLKRYWKSDNEIQSVNRI